MKCAACSVHIPEGVDALDDSIGHHPMCVNLIKGWKWVVPDGEDNVEPSVLKEMETLKKIRQKGRHEWSIAVNVLRYIAS